MEQVARGRRPHRFGPLLPRGVRRGNAISVREKLGLGARAHLYVATDSRQSERLCRSGICKTNKVYD